MSARLPDGAELRFVEHQGSGTVHLQVVLPSRADNSEPIETYAMDDGPGRMLAALVGSPTVVLCGQRTWPYDPSAGARWQHAARFADEALCRSCYARLHPEDQHLAFEHEVTR